MLIEDELRPFIELPPALASKAQEELREPVCPKQCCSRVQELLNRLQDAGLGPDTPWMCGRAQAHAVMYLRWAKWDVHKALKRLLAYAKWHTAAFGDEDPRQWKAGHFQLVFDSGVSRCIGRKSSSGVSLYTLRPLRAGCELQDPKMLLRFHAWLLQRDVMDKQLHVNGMLIVYSFEGCTFNAMAQWLASAGSVTPLICKFISECAPYRVQEILVVHPPSWFSWGFSFFKPFLSEKMRSRLSVIGKDHMYRLHALFDPDVLPTEFGGTHPDCGEAHWEEMKKSDRNTVGKHKSELCDRTCEIENNTERIRASWSGADVR